MKRFAHVEHCLCPQEPLVSEGSVPVAGFSRDLRLSPDVQRYWFSYALRGEVALPVHLVFSPGTRAAEIKAADLKAYRVDGVDSPCEVRERWRAWWKSGRRSSPGFTAPRRTGNAPRLAPASS